MKKNKTQKIIRIILTVMMLISALPVQTFAEDDPDTTAESVSVESSVMVEGENIEVTITITPDETDPSKTTTAVETQEGGVTTPTGAEVNYQEIEVSSTTVNPDETQTVTDELTGSYTYEAESDGIENAPDVTLNLIEEGEEVENPTGSADAGLLPDGLSTDEETGEVIVDKAVEMTGEDAMYDEDGKIYDEKTVTGQTDRVVTADSEATNVNITEGDYTEETLGDGYDYSFKSSDAPDGKTAAIFYYKLASSDSWDYQYAARQITLVDINGTPNDTTDDVIFDTAYCIDESTSVPAGPLQGELGKGDILYRLANLEDSGYYPDTEDGTLAEDHLRYIILNGYTYTKPTEGQTEVSTLDNTESLDSIIEMMKNAVDEDGNALYPDIDFSQLTAVEAANATQMAIWRFGNQSGELYDFQARYTDSTDETKAASADRINALYEYLIQGTMSIEQAEEDGEESTEIINEDKFIKDLSITVGQKSENEEHQTVNTDDNKDNDVYNVDLTFTLYVEPGENDDLVVSIVGADGSVIRKARISGDSSNDDANIFVKLFKNEETPNSYTFKDLQLAENSDVSFDLTLEGIQYLKEGVYIYRPMGYTSEDGTVYSDGETSQTFVTKRSGTADVDVKATVNLNFNVQEAEVKVEREWKYEAQYDLQVIDDGDPTVDPGEDPKDPDNPVNPDNPETPENPENPENPDNPENPNNLETQDDPNEEPNPTVYSIPNTEDTTHTVEWAWLMFSSIMLLALVMKKKNQTAKD